MTASPWWAPHVYADRRPFLLARMRITAAAAGVVFGACDFVEVETAILQVSPGNEAHLHAFATELIAPDASRTPLYLHTSPEFAAKKLLAAGEPRLFTFARVFRNRERGALHHPEFTMLEWYRANEPYAALIEDCAALLAAAAEAAGTKRFAFRGREADPFAAPERLTVAEAFRALCRDRPAGDARRSAMRWRQRRKGRACASPMTTPGPTCSAACSPSASSRTSASAARRCSTNIRYRRPRWRGRPRTIRASPSASSFMCAASRSRMRSAN